jgi:predicted nucleotidyltransferase component of viral defense system
MINKYLFENLKNEAWRWQIPEAKNRALIREYLQAKIIYYLYEESQARHLSFMGGTSLRLLKNLDRFSEDLDFDNLGLKFRQINVLFLRVQEKLKQEGIESIYQMKKTDHSGIGSFKFEKLLFDLEISSHKEEKLVIKINHTTPKIKPIIENIVFTRFGIVQNVVTNTQEFVLSQKMRAVLTRKEIQPRDFYDIVWLVSRNITPDENLFPEMSVQDKKELFLKLKKIYLNKLKPNIIRYKKRLSPFLINEKEVNYIDSFVEVLENNLLEKTL